MPVNSLRVLGFKWFSSAKLFIVTQRDKGKPVLQRLLIRLIGDSLDRKRSSLFPDTHAWRGKKYNCAGITRARDLPCLKRKARDGSQSSYSYNAQAYPGVYIHYKIKVPENALYLPLQGSSWRFNPASRALNCVRQELQKPNRTKPSSIVKYGGNGLTFSLLANSTRVPVQQILVNVLIIQLQFKGVLVGFVYFCQLRTLTSIKEQKSFLDKSKVR